MLTHMCFCTSRHVVHAVYVYAVYMHAVYVHAVQMHQTTSHSCGEGRAAACQAPHAVQGFIRSRKPTPWTHTSPPQYESTAGVVSREPYNSIPSRFILFGTL